MQFIRKSLVPALVSIIFLFAIGYAMRFAYVNLTEVLYLDSTDTLDNPTPQIYRPSDLGNMFDERGFMKSNAVSFDDKEIINDFNGNLMYQIPIIRGKGYGDLFYDVSLNYNGNVSYQVITADPMAQYWLFGQLHQYNFTAPGWIFSFNGLAVQMLTFESHYFTRPDNNNEAIGKNVHLLANGYNLTDRLTTVVPTGGDRDKITIMMGDGSTETLENSGYGYEGIYTSKTLNSFLKAKVVNGDDAGSLRVMYLMKGDGLTYIYKEYNVQYRDNDGSFGTTPWFKPQIFLLSEVKDRFGHKYVFDYDNGGSNKIGRPRLTSCQGVIFNYVSYWDTYYGLYLTTMDGYYKLYTEPFGIYSDQNHRPNLRFIVNPSGETMNFEYEQYIRTGIHLYNYPNHYDLTVKLGGTAGGTPLSRLKKVVNFDGGVREYSYVEDADLTADYDLPTIQHAGAHVTDQNKYKGQGRDFFFANMLDEVKVKDGSQLIRSETFTYTYTLSQTRDFANVWLHPIDTSDQYITERVISSSFSTYNYNTPTSKKSTKIYRNYATREIPSGERTDYDGTIKLVKDEQFSGSEQTAYKVLTYTYNRDIATNSQTDFDGTFLDSVFSENYDGKIRQWVYNYSGGGLSLINEKTEIDPLGRKTITHYKHFDISDDTVFSEGTLRIGTTQTYDDTLQFYLIQQPDSIKIIKGTTVLQKKKFEYYNPASVITSDIAGGYAGQLFKEKDIDPQNNSVLREIIYVYSNRDTLGKYVYGTSLYSSPKEGNIKEITDARGNKTKYYYDIISRDEDVNFIPCMNNNNHDEIFCPPRFTRHKVYDNGVDTIESTHWRDYRLPSRIDRYVNSARYLSNYQSYNHMGNLIAMVDNNNYVSEAEYEKYGRLAKVTLPYDFSHAQPEATRTYLYNTAIVELLVQGKGWGKKNDLASDYCTSGNFYFKNWQNIGDITYSCGNGFYTHIRQSGIEDDPNDRKMTAIIQYIDENFQDISSIDSAFLDFGPYYLKALYDGSPTTDYNFIVRPMKQLGSCQNVVMSGTSQGFGNISFSSSTDCGTNCMSDPYVINNVHLGNHKRLDVTELLESSISTQNGLELQGLNFDIIYTGSGIELREFELDFLKCKTTDINMWLVSGSPKLFIYGHKIIQDTIITINYPSGTLMYIYDDRADTVSVLSKIDKQGGSNRQKKTTHFFDKFGKLKESKLYTGSSSASSTKTYYNYLDGKGKVTDARNNDTKFSYDKYGNLSKTTNADNSENLISDSYQSSLTTNYYTISSGFVNKKTYTDETNRTFSKYFDAVGNLLREEKTVAGDGNGNIQNRDDPYDPDTTYEGQDAPSQMIDLITDYKYDDLYRVTEVKTPAGKLIKYEYDLFGRQSRRETPDAGVTKYLYDKNNNLTYSQDASQLARGNSVYTFRTYDGLNRLLTLGENQPGGGTEFDEIEEGTEYDASGSDNLFVINAYDSLAYAPITNLFTNVPSDYYTSAANNTKGNLVATAYKTKLADGWSFKFYRYDARGRVIRFWHYIAGLGWKSENDYYNSQNQMIRNWYQPNQSDGKVFAYSYDDAARLKSTSLYLGTQPQEPEEESDAPTVYLNLTNYTYNANSQVDEHKLSNNQYAITYSYNSRNWVQYTTVSPSIVFRYVLAYNTNGNIRYQDLQGSYANNFSTTGNRKFLYTYDNSNRLLKANDVLMSDSNSYDLINNYDKDGNFISMKRYGSSNNLVDNFGYEYFTGTNRLKKVSDQSNDDYAYDNNGNMTKDELNKNYNCLYDHRNLMTDIRSVRQETGIFGPENKTYWTVYKYDEAGNRVRKTTYKYNGSEPDPVYEDGGDNPSWEQVANEFYVRDVSGKEIALYSGTSLTQWNIWGLDNVGKINSDTTKYYYLKDHLGSTRCVINSTNGVVSANDYDCWGYALENRTYQSDNTQYKFTGKERDNESNYDYFGARYYDSRIANWGSIDPLFEKHFDFTPYNYVLRGPIVLIDPDGKQGRFGNLQKAYEGGGGDMGIAILAGLAIKGAIELGKIVQETLDPSKEQVTITQSVTEQAPELGKPYMESSTATKHIIGAVGQIIKHLDKISGKTPNSGDPNQWKDKWKKDIEKQINKIKKHAEKLKKDPQKVIEELINKSKLNKEKMEKAFEELKQHDIQF